MSHELPRAQFGAKRLTSSKRFRTRMRQAGGRYHVFADLDRGEIPTSQWGRLDLVFGIRGWSSRSSEDRTSSLRRGSCLERSLC